MSADNRETFHPQRLCNEMLSIVKLVASFCAGRLPAERCCACCLAAYPSIARREPVTRMIAIKPRNHRWTAWLGHWVQEFSEDEKCDAAMCAAGVPYVVRKLLLQFKAERRFRLDSNGYLVICSRTLTGAWIDVCSAPGTTEHSSFFGYTIHSEMSWDGSTMVSTHLITDPSGDVKKTVSTHVSAYTPNSCT